MVSWFVTRKGRYFTYSIVSIFSASAFGMHLLLHGPYLKHYQSVMQLYERSKPKPVSSDLLAKAQGVLQDCQLSEKQKQSVSFFTTVGTEVFHAGGYNFPWGAIIGLPCTFDSKMNFKFQDMKLIGRDNIDWEIEGFDFLETIKLPDAAQKFAIARGIYSADITNAVENGIVAFVSCIVPAQFCWYYNKRKNALKFPLKQRILPYLFCYAWGLLFYICARNPFKHVHDKKCDEKAAMLGPEYLQGGIWFYENLLERNKALRTLCGKTGESRFTEEGNVRRMLLAPKLPITARLELLKKMGKEQSSG